MQAAAKNPVGLAILSTIMPWPIVGAAASSAGSFFAKLATSALLSKVPATRTIRRWGANRQRETRTFGLPLTAGPTLVVVPRLPTATGDFRIAEFDNDAGDAFGTMLQRFGFAKGKDWNILSTDQPLSDVDRRRDLVLLCGSNPMVRELLHDHPGILTSVRYHHDQNRLHRAFEWRGTLYRWNDEQDFALVAIKPNPYNPKARLVLLFGTRAIGTLGAAKLYSDDRYKPERQQIAEQYATAGGVEVLLRVRHPLKRDSITDITVAEPRDGEPAAAPRLRPVDNDAMALSRVYDSLSQYPSSTFTSDLFYETTVTPDCGLKFRFLVTWGFGEHDVVVQSRFYSVDCDLHKIEDLKFECRVVNGGGEIVPLIVTDEPQQRRFLVFPIPPIRKSDQPRRYEFLAEWPNGAHKLRHIGDRDKHTIQIPEQVFGDIDRVRVRLVFESPGTFVVTPRNFAVQEPDCSRTTFGIDRPLEFELTHVVPGKNLVMDVTRKA